MEFTLFNSNPKIDYQVPTHKSAEFTNHLPASAGRKSVRLRTPTQNRVMAELVSMARSRVVIFRIGGHGPIAPKQNLYFRVNIPIAQLIF